MMWLEFISVLFFGLAMAGFPCCCGGCGCYTVPDTVTVVISGVANGAGCTDCDTIINGTFVVDMSSPGNCIGRITQVGPDCFDHPDADNFWILVTISDLGDPSHKYNVKITDVDAPESFHETAEIAGSDCCAIDEDVPQYFAPTMDCDWSVATVHITASC